MCVVLPLGFRLTKAENGLRGLMKLHRVHEGLEFKVCGFGGRAQAEIQLQLLRCVDVRAQVAGNEV